MDIDALVAAAKEIDRNSGFPVMASEMRKFWRSLKRHPGVLSAAAMTLFGFAVGGWGGAVIAGLYWVPVLLTAWEMRDRVFGDVAQEQQGGGER